MPASVPRRRPGARALPRFTSMRHATTHRARCAHAGGGDCGRRWPELPGCAKRAGSVPWRPRRAWRRLCRHGRCHWPQLAAPLQARTPHLSHDSALHTRLGKSTCMRILPFGPGACRLHANSGSSHACFGHGTGWATRCMARLLVVWAWPSSQMRARSGTNHRPWQWRRPRQCRPCF